MISSPSSRTTAARDLANIEDGENGSATMLYDTGTLASGRWTTEAPTDWRVGAAVVVFWGDSACGDRR